jgi:WD40 repeat protein
MIVMFLHHVDSVTSLKLGNDSQCYLASLTNSTIQLMDGPSGKLLNTFKGHKQEKYRLESIFSADESTVLSGSEDSMVYAWDLVSGEIIRKLAGHSGAVVSIAQHPKNNAKLLSASADGTIKLWI